MEYITWYNVIAVCIVAFCTIMAIAMHGAPLWESCDRCGYACEKKHLKPMVKRGIYVPHYVYSCPYCEKSFLILGFKVVTV
jgi:hypothetical protein